MDRNRLTGIARMHMGAQKSHQTRERGFIYYHGLRTAKLALHLSLRIPETVGVDEDVLFAGALFHDLGKGGPEHNVAGAVRAMSILNGACGKDELRAVAELIEHHNLRDRSPALPVASRIVQDADILDHMGGQMVWLSLFWSANHDRGPDETLEYYYSEEHQAYIERLRSLLNFDAAVAEFDSRRMLQETFFKRLGEEMEGRFVDETTLPVSGEALPQ